MRSSCGMPANASGSDFAGADFGAADFSGGSAAVFSVVLAAGLASVLSVVFAALAGAACLTSLAFALAAGFVAALAAGLSVSLGYVAASGGCTCAHAGTAPKDSAKNNAKIAKIRVQRIAINATLTTSRR